MGPSEADTGARKIIARMVLPLVFLIFLSSLDRVNVSFAQLRMGEALDLSPSAYGLGVSLFFIGYLLFQAPSLWLLDRVGARLWIAATVFCWGLIATAMTFVETKTHFYILRVLLGFAEAGFAPGIALTCSRWLPRRHLTATISKTTLAIPISVIVGGPLSTWLMSISNPLGMDGWRWMFLAEGLPTVILGVLALFWFIDTPAGAKWLTPDERAVLEAEIAAERAAIDAKGNAVPVGALLRSVRVWAAAFCWFATLVGAYGVIYWLPLVVKELSGASDIQVGFLSALPWIGVGLGMLIGGALSDRAGERYFHVALPAIFAGAGMAAAAYAGHSWAALALLTLAGFGYGASQGAFWGLPTGFLTGAAASTGVAFINTIGSSGGLVGPQVFGWLREETGGFTIPVLAMAALLVAGGLAVLAIRPRAAPALAPTQTKEA
jgi:ACS family tartrate transporter-like MFS transporter